MALLATVPLIETNDLPIKGRVIRLGPVNAAAECGHSRLSACESLQKQVASNLYGMATSSLR